MSHTACAETIIVEVDAPVEPEGYEALISAALKRAMDALPGCAIQRKRSACGGHFDIPSDDKDEWYIGCVHAGISKGGQIIAGKVTFVLYGSEE